MFIYKISCHFKESFKWWPSFQISLVSLYFIYSVSLEVWKFSDYKEDFSPGPKLGIQGLAEVDSCKDRNIYDCASSHWNELLIGWAVTFSLDSFLEFSIVSQNPNLNLSQSGL